MLAFRAEIAVLRRSFGFVLVVAAIGGVLPVFAQEPDPGAAWPVWLEGVDLGQPAQVAFAAWPPRALEERLYPLPWSDLTFQRANLFQMPVLMVMTVPWSRAASRMAEETLADPAVLRAINAQFLTVVVSADRRPDLRARYQSGTWPVVTLLLPDGRPMLSQANPTGKALPITLGYASPDTMLFTLAEGRLYFDKWASVLKGVAGVYEERLADVAPQAAPLRPEASDQMARWLVGNADAKHGGFGAAPKYVLPGLAEYAAIRDARFLPALVDPARDTIEKLVRSPLWDGVGGGVRRMAAAPDWGEIQTEKMLDGNADLLRDLVFAIRRSDSEPLRAATRETARFLTSTLARPGGGFYNARIAEGARGDAPETDRLVLSGGNARAGAALLRAGVLLGDPEIVRSGRAALDLVLTRAWSPARGVAHVIEPGREETRFLETQADVAFALVDAHETTGETRYLDAARDIAEFVANNMLTRGEVAARDFLPSGRPFGLLTMPKWPMTENVRIARTMTRLAVHLGSERFRTLAASLVGAFSQDCTAYGVRGIDPALALEELAREPLVVDVDGPPDDRRTVDLRRQAVNLPHPWTIVRPGNHDAEPGLVLARGGAKERATRPDDVARIAATLTSASADTP